MDNRPVGVFDSGMGGISVLKSLVKILPEEDFIYYGDSANAPYGSKADQDVALLSRKVFDYFMDRGCKAVVVACNTATSVAVAGLRQDYPDIPIIGIEPAIKPAAEHHKGGRIVVMATAVTLRRRKFAELMEIYNKECEIIPLPCPGLVEFIEQDNMDSPEMLEYLRYRFATISDRPADAVVLGCTHYPFIKKQIKKIAGPQAVLYDGSEGTSRELRRRLQAAGLEADPFRQGSVSIENSAGPEKAELSRRLFEMEI